MHALKEWISEFTDAHTTNEQRSCFRQIGLDHSITHHQLRSVTHSGGHQV